MLLHEIYRHWIWLVGGIAGYLLLMLANPARRSLRDGIRCLGRHCMIWAILMLFGLCYAIFQIWLDWHEQSILAEGMRPVFLWYRPWFLPGQGWIEVLKESLLPAAESLAGLFNVFVATFPFSAIASVLFLVNWDNHHAVLFRALRRRFGGWGWLIHGGILLCAIAALVKPCIYGPLLQRLGEKITDLHALQCSSVVNWLSFLFEIMFGTAVQVYLILMVYAWVRGLNFTHRHLIDFAIRRFSYVMKWSALGMLLGTVLIYLPMIFANIPEVTNYFQAHMPSLTPYFEPYTMFHFVDHWGRPVMAGFFILFSGMQIILTFHSESLAKAVRDLLHFLRRHAWPVGWYLAVAFVHFYILNALNLAIQKGFGSDTGPVLAWSLVYPLVNAFIGGWLLAAWVCLYKRSETGRVRDENWIQY